MVTRRIVCFLALALGALGAARGEVTAQLERQQIRVDESVRLIIEHKGEVSGGKQIPTAEPNLAVLRAHFHVLGSSQAQNVSIAGDKQTFTRTWTIELEAKSDGIISIPPMQIGEEKTPVAVLTVLPKPAPTPEAPRDVFFEVDVEPKNPYVQQQTTLTLRLFLSAKFKAQRLNINRPAHKDLIVKQIGRDTQYNKKINALDYRVYELRYHLQPQKSGLIALPPFELTGVVNANDKGVVSRKRLREKSAGVQIQVRPPNPKFSGNAWLPAKDLRIFEAAPPTSLSLGQPANRVITIQSRGLGGEQLPEIELESDDAYRVYADIPKHQTRVENGDLIGELRQSIAIIPARAGELALPPITVNWWDTTADAQRQATLPAHTWTVKAAPPGQSEAKVADLTREDATPIDGGAPAFAPNARGWQIASAVLLCLWLGTAVFAWRQHATRKKRALEKQQAVQASIARALKALRVACEKNRATETRQALLQWAAAIWRDDPPLALSDIAARIGQSEWTQCIAQLDAAIYAGADKTDTDWQAKKLHKLARGFRKPRQSHAARALPALYPEG